MVIASPAKLMPESTHKIAITTGVKKLQNGTIQLTIMQYTMKIKTNMCMHLDAITQLEKPRMKYI